MTSATHSFPAIVVAITIVRWISRHCKWYRTVSDSSVSYRQNQRNEEKKDERRTERWYSPPLDSRPHSPLSKSMSKSLSLSSHMVLRHRKACRLLSLGIVSAYMVEATASLYAYSMTAHTHLILSHDTSNHSMTLHLFAPPTHLKSHHITPHQLTSSHLASPHIISSHIDLTVSQLTSPHLIVHLCLLQPWCLTDEFTLQRDSNCTAAFLPPYLFLSLVPLPTIW